MALYKSLTFGVSALYTGIAGALSALVVAIRVAGQLRFFLSISFLVGIVVGGLASISGAVFGALFIQFIPNVADHISKSAPWAVYGVLSDCIHVLRCRRASPARCEVIWARFCRTR